MPQSYSPKTPIKLYLNLYSPSAANNILMETDTYLIRKNTDAVDSTTNKHDSTNTEITNTVAKQIRQIEIDLTSSVGAINSVDVSAGDSLLVNLFRNASAESSSDTADTRVLPTVELKF